MFHKCAVVDYHNNHCSGTPTREAVVLTTGNRVMVCESCFKGLLAQGLIEEWCPCEQCIGCPSGSKEYKRVCSGLGYPYFVVDK